MIKLVVLFALTSMTLVSSQFPYRPYAILRSYSDVTPYGSYQYLYDTENGISVQEQGQQKYLPQGSGTAAAGSYRYTSPEGIPVVVNYVADENGYQPQSNVLPTPPPIPPAILKSLEYIAARTGQPIPSHYRRH
ncbi:larval cuticle protein LCP-22-like [Sitophilus oryzae]|uniref:Larval cuticle protein LCP-22-like n=1 Tax=Sitophilus oryzae TaxID=7048 RepID=A0A6J2XEH3_SITOR|nr:larval cuticle protein LCP-22-like [Sitophilus oryzae]